MSSLSPITARYAETDRMGVIHHSVYPVWYEVARTDYIKTLGLTYSQLEEMGVMTPLVSLTSQYHRAAYYEDRLLVECTLSALPPRPDGVHLPHLPGGRGRSPEHRLHPPRLGRRQNLPPHQFQKNASPTFMRKWKPNWQVRNRKEFSP